jgi:hypothetical protein
MKGDDIEINIKPFDVKKLKKDSTVVLIGKKRMGKSFLVRDLLYHNRDIPLGTVISHTDHLQNYYDKFIPGMLIYKNYDPTILKKIFERQEKAIKEKWDNPYIFLLFDDCLSDSRNWAKDEKIKEIFYNGRWYKIFFILTMQAVMAIPPGYRSNIDYVFIFKNNIYSDRERIYKNYAGMFPSKEIFDHVLDACTEDYHCLVIDNTTDSNKLEDMVFVYKAQNHEDFRMCSQPIWRLNDQRYAGIEVEKQKKSSSKTIRGNQKLTIKF